MLVEVAFRLALEPLTYSVPEPIRNAIKPGVCVSARLRNKRMSGYVVSIHPEGTEFSYRINDLLDISDEMPALPGQEIKFIQWLANYYHYPVGVIIGTALPPNMRLKTFKTYALTEAGRQIDEITRRKFSARGGKRINILTSAEQGNFKPAEEQKTLTRKLVQEGYLTEEFHEKEPQPIQLPMLPVSTEKHRLNPDQKAAFDAVALSVDQKSPETFLLQGVTGSGKTEVYLAAAERTVSQGRNVIIMVPEIALTPQLYTRVFSRFGDKTAIMHSGLTDYQRTEQWFLIRRGKAKIALGARSTIFAPMDNIGLIVIDEEHESAFKQEDRFRYNARDMAAVKARHHGATVILGSATPSLETYLSSITGKIRRLELPARVSGRSLPETKIIDLSREMMEGSFSGTLIKHITRTLEAEKQAMLFLNRRGYASFLTCDECGHVPNCPSCSVSMTKYRHSGKLVCHYCGYSETTPVRCPECGCKDLRLGIPGTEQIEEQARRLFPEARICRIDRDTVHKTEDLEQLLIKIARKEVDLIIGTQMIAKGHDFPDVELVAIIDADSSFRLPDFRANERSYQLFTQMAGRAGRGDWPGRVIIQTRQPDHPSIRCIKEGTFQDFAGDELSLRKDFHYPPYTRIARLLFTSANEAEAASWSKAAAAELIQHESNDLEVLGPAPALMQKIQNKYRWNILLKAGKATTVNQYLKTYLPHWRKQVPKSVQIAVDVDPISLL